MTDLNIPPAFKKVLLPGEEALATTKSHGLWVLGWWLKPLNFLIGLCTFGLAFLYAYYLKKNEVMILTNKRIIGSVNPKLFTKDKIELSIKAVDNLKEDETLLGNIFGWTAIQIESRSDRHTQFMVTKESVKQFRTKFYEAQK